MRNDIARIIAFFCVLSVSCHAAMITFDDIVSGVTTYTYDGDADGTNDVLFSTTDSSGFNSIGPGLSMNFINEPGIEGTSQLGVDLRADFLFGATVSIRFGFALSTPFDTFGATFELYDGDDNMIASKFQLATYQSAPVVSTAPEAILDLAFSGVASYGLFKFDAEPGRFIVDNFEGAFGSSEVVPEPASLMLLGFSGVAVAFVRRRLKR